MAQFQIYFNKEKMWIITWQKSNPDSLLLPVLQNLIVSPAWSISSNQGDTEKPYHRELLGKLNEEGFQAQVLQDLSSSLCRDCHNKPNL